METSFRTRLKIIEEVPYFLEKISSAYIFILCLCALLNFLYSSNFFLYYKYISTGQDYYGTPSVNECSYL